VSVAWNALLAPFVGLLLFPASALAMLVPPFVALSDVMWRGFMGVLAAGPHGLPLGNFVTTANLAWLPAVTHFLLLTGEVQWRRKRAFS
jgi:hypothetical protein